MVGDLAGFCSASFYRGIAYVQLPTSVTAQVDSAIGGKTGINLPEGKNLVGAFHQPSLVVADVNSLKTLPIREFNEGCAEMIKHAVIKSPNLLKDLLNFRRGNNFNVAGGLVNFISDDMASIVKKNVAIKARIVEADEREKAGVRALLNFGHTVGHGIEAVAGYGSLLHGEAISLGMRAAGWLSVEKKSLAESDFELLLSVLKAFDLPLNLPKTFASAEAILEIIMHDKKFKQGKISFVLLDKIGSARISAEISHEDILASIRVLR